MTSTNNPILDGAEWVFPDGKRLPLVHGGEGPKAGSGDTITIPADPADPAPANGDPAPATDPAPKSANEQMFTADQIEAARKQEKDKLYPRITTLEGQLAAFNADKDQAADAAATVAAQQETDRKAREADELSAKELLAVREDEFNTQLNEVQTEWEVKFNKLEDESNARQALLDQERKFQELESFKTRRLAEESENLMPELIGFVGGNSEDEIEASISAVAERSSAIVESIQETLPAQPARPRGIPATGGSTTGPLENATEQQTLTSADIANMSMDQYAEVRDRLLASASGRSR